MPNSYSIKTVSMGLALCAGALMLTACGGGQDFDPPSFEPEPTPAPTSGPEPTPMPIPSNDHNLLLNPGLELGAGDDFVGWNKLNGGDNITASFTDTCFGRGAQAVSTGSNTWDVQIASAPVVTKVDTNYTASVWIKADMATTVKLSTQPQETAQYQDPPADVTTEWQQITWTFKANSTSTILVLDMGGSTATYNIDEIRLVEGDTPDPSNCPYTSTPDDNLLYNGALEYGDGDEFYGWSKYNGGDNMVETFNDGCFGRALKATGLGSNAWDVQLASNAAPTEVSTADEPVDYTASVWIKGSAPGGIVQFETNPNPQYSGGKEIGTEWQRLTWTFKPNEPSTLILLDMGQSEVTYTIDDFELVKGSFPSESTCPHPGPDGNYVYNGGMELGTGDDFAGWEKRNGADGMTATTEQKHSGQRALKVVSTGNDKWNVQLVTPIQTPLREDGNKVTYIASAWIKAENEGSTVRFAASGDPDTSYQGDQAIGTEWQELTWEFTASKATTELFIDMGGSEETFYIDDVSVVPK